MKKRQFRLQIREIVMNYRERHLSNTLICEIAGSNLPSVHSFINRIIMQALI